MQQKIKLKVNTNEKQEEAPSYLEQLEEEVEEEAQEVPEPEVEEVIEEPKVDEELEKQVEDVVEEVAEEVKKKKKPKRKKNAKTLTADEEHKRYKTRKLIVYIAFIVTLVAVIGFSLYATFFKHTLTPQEAALYTNQYNSQGKSQAWDTGVQSFLQRNLKSILKKDIKVSGNDGQYNVSNISVEKNQPIGDDTFMTFFSFDISAGGKAKREYGVIFIKIADNEFRAISNVTLTMKKPFSANGTVVEDDNPSTKFDVQELDDKATKSFKPVMENFLTLGYNSKQDVGNIYKGSSKLEFNGTFKSLDKVAVYSKPNPLGCNAEATYTIEIEPGITYKTTCYMKIEKNSSDAYVIKSIL